MALYYYISASLPLLVAPEQGLPMSSVDFLEICGRFLTAKDYGELEASTLDPEGPPAGGIAAAFRLWERSLRNQLVFLRARGRDLDPEGFLRPGEIVLEVRAIASKAMAIASPLQAELYLDSQRWDHIENLAWGHDFDLEFLRGYRMKLLLMERRALFDEERGFSAYRTLHSRILATFPAERDVI